MHYWQPPYISLAENWFYSVITYHTKLVLFICMGSIIESFSTTNKSMKDNRAASVLHNYDNGIALVINICIRLVFFLALWRIAYLFLKAFTAYSGSVTFQICSFLLTDSPLGRYQFLSALVKVDRPHHSDSLVPATLRGFSSYCYETVYTYFTRYTLTIIVKPFLY